MIVPPRVANNDAYEINKALILMASLADGGDSTVREEMQAADNIAASSIISLNTSVDILARSLKAGGSISYAGVADTHTIQPLIAGIWYQGTAPGAVMRRYLVAVPQTTITSAMPGYPAAGAWAYVTVDYRGIVRLRAATGAGTVRPTDNFFKFSGGGVGYQDIDRNGYYYSDGERIVGVIHKITATSFLYIVNGAEASEVGEYIPTIYFSTVPGVQTYTKTVGRYRTDGKVSECWGWARITAKDPAGAGEVRVTAPFPNYDDSLGADISYTEGLTYNVGYTHLSGVWWASSSEIYIFQKGSGVASTGIPYAQVASNCNIMWRTQGYF